MSIEIENQHAAACVYDGTSEEILSRSGAVASVVRTGAGAYVVTLLQDIPRAVLVPHVFGRGTLGQVTTQASRAAPNQIAVATREFNGDPIDVVWSLQIDVMPNQAEE